ncbi:MAG: transposase, partial [Planctomycetota bacterium]
MVVAAADHAGAGARRGGHPPLGEATLARSKKNLGLSGTVVFVDETGFSERPPLRRSWAPRGETPVVRMRGRSWRRVSGIGALAYRLDGSDEHLLFGMHDEATRTEHILRF